MDVLEVHLQNHWAAAAGGLDLATRVARTHADSDVGADLASVARDIAEDRETLRELMVVLDLDPGTVGPVVARVAERIGRLKPNGRALRRSPVSDVLELEALRAAIGAKRAGWDTLLVLSQGVDLLPRDGLRRLRDRADAQLERLAEVQATVVRHRRSPAIA